MFQKGGKRPDGSAAMRARQDQDWDCGRSPNLQHSIAA